RHQGARRVEQVEVRVEGVDELVGPVGGRACLQPQGVGCAADVDRVPVLVGGWRAREVETRHQHAGVGDAGGAVNIGGPGALGAKQLRAVGGVELGGGLRVAGEDVHEQVALGGVIEEGRGQVDDDVERVRIAGATA